jgi:hypothetical protein
MKAVTVELTSDELKEMTRGALSRFFTSMTNVYTNKRIPTYVAMTHDRPHTDGDNIYMPDHEQLTDLADLDYVDEYRVRLDSLAHECEHINNGNSEEQFKEVLKKIGANSWTHVVYNAIEDSRINYTRAVKFPGMRITEAWKYGLYNEHFRNPVHEVKDINYRLPEAILSIQETGKVKGNKRKI